MSHIPKFKQWSLLENHNSDKIDAIKDVLRIKTNFTVCKRCGKQLHHSITTCSRCGQRHEIGSGKNIEAILYRLKHRPYQQYPTSITPADIYASFASKLQDAGVTEDDFVQYVKDHI